MNIENLIDAIINSISNFFIAFWVTSIKDAQKEYRKDHCLNKYDDNNWKDNIYW
jgi:hypothetical protein